MMTYTRGLALAGGLFAAVVIASNAWLVMQASDWASDDMHVGHGHSGFPPQAPYQPGERR